MQATKVLSIHTAAWLRVLTGLLVVPAFGAHAADGLDVESPPADTLREVVVTARKREESLQKVPVSVTAVTGDELQQRSLTSLQELGNATPNVSFYTQGQSGRTAGQVFVRGIGQADPVVTNDPGVGIYVDGVYLGRMQGLDLDMMDLSRVEVLRGPQGTLFGKNTIGGAINIVTTPPSLEETSGNIQLTGGSFRRHDAMARVNLPIKPDRLGLSFAISSRNQDGYGTRLLTGESMGNSKSLTARAALLFRASDNLDLQFAADRTRVREEAAVIKLLTVDPSQSAAVMGLNGFLGATGQPLFDQRWVTPNDYTSNATGANTNDADIWGVSFTATYKAGANTLKSITSFRRNSSDRGVDPDGSPYQLIDELGHISQQQASQELQLSGTSFGERLNWVTGLYYFNEKAYERTTDYVFTPLAPVGVNLSFQTHIRANNDAYALYGQGTYALTEQLHLTVGLRETHERKTGSVYWLGWFPPYPVTLPYQEGSSSWNALSPRLGLEYQVTPEVMTYVSVANGFKSGGFNGRATAAAGFVRYNPEKAWTFEMGIRSDLLDRRLRLNATAFYTSYRDIQFTVIQGNTNGQPDTVVGNAGKARITGGELELAALLAPHFTVKVSGGLTDAKYTEVEASTLLTTASHFIDTPKWTGTFAAEYAWLAGDRLEVLARADATSRALTYLDAANSPLVTQGAYTLLNARLTMRMPGHGWSVSVFGTNLSDKQVYSGGTDFRASLGFAEVNMAPPREWGATLEYRF